MRAPRTVVILLLALVAVVGLAVYSAVSAPQRASVGSAAPPIVSETLDGVPFDLTSLRGRPILVNFWGPSCIPCRDEFPLFKETLAHADVDDLAIVGVLEGDAPADAQRFMDSYGATWPTVVDPDGTIAGAYRFAARPQTYFIDRAGVLRSIQIGQLTQADLERQLDRIAG